MINYFLKILLIYKFHKKILFKYIHHFLKLNFSAIVINQHFFFYKENQILLKYI
jgi:hypothetical protein